MRIGVFDSGLGGLVITKAFIHRLPEYDYFYYGDTEHLPYGEKSSEQIMQYSLEAIKYLIAQKCSLIIMACNTATAVTLRYIQQKFIPTYAPDVKVLGVVIPTVEEALLDGAKKVGVIATQATVGSQIYAAELHKIKPELDVLEIAAPELVPAIENNDFETAEKVVADYAPKFKGMDSLILGCTHYPLVKDFFRKALPQVRVISQDDLMGDKLEDYLKRHIEIDICLNREKKYEFVVSTLNQHYQEAAKRLFADISIRAKEEN